MEDAGSMDDLSSDTDSKISVGNESHTKQKSSNTDTVSKKSTAGTAKFSSSSIRPSKVTHIYKNDRSLKAIPEFKEDFKDTSVVYLQNNNIQNIEHLENFANLTHLYLQWNKIKTIENLGSLKKLTKLYLSHNEISVVENLEGLESLTELHIGKQILKSGDSFVFDPQCMEILSTRLSLLNISGNRLTELEPIIRMPALKILIAKDNNIKNLENTAYNLSRLGNLTELFLTGNAICKMPHYKEKIIAKCRSLEVIDGQPISDQTRNFLNSMENRRMSIIDIKEKKETLRKPKSKVVFEDHKRESPNAFLMQLEAKRLAAARSRELRLKQLDCTKGQVPRCFWRNIRSERVIEYVNQPQDDEGESNKDSKTFVWP